MATIEQFKQVRASVGPDVQKELYMLAIKDLDAAVAIKISIGNDNNVSFTPGKISFF